MLSFLVSNVDLQPKFHDFPVELKQVIFGDLVDVLLILQGGPQLVVLLLDLVKLR